MAEVAAVPQQERWQLTRARARAPLTPKRLPHGPDQRGLRECVALWERKEEWFGVRSKEGGWGEAA